MKRNICCWSLTFAGSLLAANALAQEEAPPAETAPMTEPAPEPMTEPPPPEATTMSAEATMDTGDAVNDKRFYLGARLGYGIGLGSVAKNVKMSDFVSGIIPIQVDIGYMVSPNFLIAGYAGYGIINVKDCDDCSAHNLRFGAEFQYHISPAEKMNPWVGAGLGYEIASTSTPLGDVSYKGFEFLNLQGGLDFQVADAVGIGPFVNFSLGQYSSLGGDASGSIPEKAMHEWLTFGVRGSFKL